MSDILNEDGLELKTLSTIVTELEDGVKSIYGDDVNVDSDTPDGQLINIIAQACIDMRELIQDVYTSFDPDEAEGTVLDQRVALNGITRKGGTFTVTPVDITVDRSVSLVGMDDDETELDIPSGVYTIKDDAGNQFVLLDSVTLSTGLTSLSFRAAEIGAVATTLNTITTAVTAIAGVTAINNSESPTIYGQDEESDAALKLRRTKSITSSSVGYLESVLAAVLAVDDVTDAKIFENSTDVTDTDGTLAHTLWAVVESGASADIANALYATKAAGCGMRGSVSQVITRPSGQTVTMNFDRPVNEDLYFRMTLALIGGGTIDEDYVKEQIVENITFTIGEDAATDTFVCFMKELDSKYRITDPGVSLDGSTWTDVVSVSAALNKFVLSTGRITIL